MNNYNKYWRNWNVLQTPKINVDALSDNGWMCYDVSFNNNISSVCTKDDISLIISYSYTGGVNKIEVKKSDKSIYKQMFSFLLKPSVDEIKKILTCAGMSDWKKYYTDC